MNFLSDNAYGVLPEVLAAVTEAASGTASSYGSDDLSLRVEARLVELFEKEIASFAVISGTAANALAIATLCPQHGAVFCHSEAHIAVDECGAPEFFTHGAKLVGIEGADGKVTPEGLTAALSHFLKGRTNESFDNLAAPSLRKALNANQDKTFTSRRKTGEYPAASG